MRHHHRAVVASAAVALLIAGALGNGGPSAVAAEPTTPSARFDVASENSRPGATGWRITQSQFTRGSLAFADRQSVLPGEIFGLYVSCRSATFRVQALRIGYYGGAGARQVWSSDEQTCTRQPGAAVVRSLGTAWAPWTKSLVVATTEWPEGMYLLHISADDGSATYVDLVVRSASTAGRVVLVSATQTFAAYNTWGGASTYTGRRGFKSRARAVSFDRPNTWGYGSGKFLKYELPLFTRAESLGLPLAYLADTDVSAQPGVLDGALSVVTGGHSEYWTQAQRDAMMTARSAGTNLLFFGSNTSYWRVRLSDSALGPNRVLTVYKSRREDPDRAQPTIRFRDVGQPDAPLLGGTYKCFPAKGAFRVTEASSWVFAGTGATAGSTYAGIIGPEVDALAAPNPAVVELAHSPIRCGKRRSYASLTLMTDPSGAATVDVGTMGWVLKAMDRKAPPATREFVRTVTDNLLRASGRRGLAPEAS